VHGADGDDEGVIAGGADGAVAVDLIGFRRFCR
jgi:hypothetical protein